MAYEYESIISGVFNFTIPGEEKTVKLFIGDKVIVQKQLAGNYLKMLKLIGEIKETDKVVEKKEPVKKTTKQKAKVADKITKVTEIETKDIEETVTIDIKDEVTTETIEEEAAPTPKKRGRRKKS